MSSEKPLQNLTDKCVEGLPFLDLDSTESGSSPCFIHEASAQDGGRTKCCFPPPAAAREDLSTEDTFVVEASGGHINYTSSSDGSSTVQR